ncbi:MAG: Rrf2 family transcriptional regulator [Ignavibacteriaceae bacterium]|nr:Rrf2 family transcriptional regulator [Ignavibacteriaceae bacterium]
MSSFFSKKCEYGLQAVLYLAAQGKSSLCSAEEISNNLNIPKEFTSKILQDLTEKGIIISRKGRVGGFKLAIDASQIKLIDIVAAIDGLDIFKNCVMGFHNCNGNQKCPVHKEWMEVVEKAYRMLSQRSVDIFNNIPLDHF